LVGIALCFLNQWLGVVSLLVGLVGLVAGIKVNTSATNFAPISQLQLAKFKGETWERFGDIISADIGD